MNLVAKSMGRNHRTYPYKNQGSNIPSETAFPALCNCQGQASYCRSDWPEVLKTQKQASSFDAAIQGRWLQQYVTILPCVVLSCVVLSCVVLSCHAMRCLVLFLSSSCLVLFLSCLQQERAHGYHIHLSKVLEFVNHAVQRHIVDVVAALATRG